LFFFYLTLLIYNRSLPRGEGVGGGGGGGPWGERDKKEDEKGREGKTRGKWEGG
jgi:hypothetical protein